MSALSGPLWIAKVSDFGTMKLKMESTAYANQTMPIGTAMFIASEGYELEDGDMQPERFHPKKTDVYSFGLICFCVLIGEPTPFPPTELMNPSVKAFKRRVRNGKRPQLPPNCPNYLSSLIQQCWDGNPLNRPDFQTICTELRYIKGCLLTGLDNYRCLQSASVRFPPNQIRRSIEVYKPGSQTQDSNVNPLSEKEELSVGLRFLSIKLETLDRVFVTIVQAICILAPADVSSFTHSMVGGW
ncbi:unnamed protein product [Sphagnum troendelagicum]|uniref:Protein kinase domain-containing protein n=1 Tax=Sphagnum troendelagicum TaxID=128251 RepID=A0ABP0U6H1_9BRYO